MRNTIAFITILAVAGLSFSAVNVTDCSVLSTPGEAYILTQDVVGAPIGSLPVTGTACLHINSSDIEFDCAGYSISHNLSMNSFGIFAGANLTNITIRNCPNITQFYRGIYLRNVNSSRIENVTAQHNSPMGYYLWETFDLTFINNTAFNNTQYGAYFTFNPRSNNISGNVFYNHSIWGLVVTNGAANNTIGDNTAFNNFGDGLVVNGPGNLVSGNLAYDNGNEIFLGNGINVAGANNTVRDNIAENNTRSGFWVVSSSDSLFTNNTAGGNARDGFYVEGGPDVNFTSNNVTGNGRHGFLLSDSNLNLFINNTVALNNVSGFNLTWGGEGDPSDNNTLQGNNITLNTMDGISLDLAIGNIILSNYIYGSGNAGIFQSPGEDPFLIGGNTYLSGNIYHFNNYDFFASSATNMSYAMAGDIFTNPDGSLENYTNLSINDTLSNEAYTISWTANSSPVDFPLTSFNDKFVDISVSLGAPSIDSIAWHYLDSEASGYDESLLGIYEYSGGWSDLGAAGDTSANTLTAQNLSSFSEFGILQSNVTENCPIIDQSGSYVQTEDFEGAPNSPSPLGGGSVCLKIAASDVVYDCNGYSISNNGTAGTTYGVFLNSSSSNVTLQNCPAISGYSYGVYLYRVNDSLFTNISVINAATAAFDVSEGHGNDFADSYGNATGYGFYLSSTANNSIVNCTVRSANAYGYLLTSSSNNTITDSSVQNCQYGIGVTAGTNNSFYGNILPINAGGYGFSVSGQNNTVIGNSVNNSAYAYYFVGSSNNTIVNNTAFNNSNYGLFFTSASFNQTVINNTFRESGIYDFFIVVSNAWCGHLVENNTGSGYRPIMFANSAVSWSDLEAAEVFLCDADGSILENVTADGSDTLRNNGFFMFLTDNGSINGSASIDNYQGFYLDSSDNNTVTANRASNASQGFGYYILNSSDNGFSGNLANYSANGFFLSSNSNRNTLLGNAANSTSASFYLSQVSGNNLTNNTAISAAGYGLYLYTAGNGTISGNSVSALYGAYISYYSSNNSITGNQMASPNEAFHLSLSSNNLIGNASINGYGAGRGVFLESGSDNNTFSNLSLGNFVYGIYLFGTNAGNSFSGSLVCNNTYGTTITRSNLTLLEDMRFCNNSRDFWIEAGSDSRVVNLSSVIFDSPAGNLTNYTNLTLDDIVSSGSSYQINWSGSGAPAGYVSFAGKSVNITNLTGTVSIDSIRWSWSESELSGYTESNFGLWKRNSSGWTLLNSTPDTADNVLGLYSMSPASDYSILSATCPIITSPGTYVQSVDLAGAPNAVDAPDLPASQACVVIDSDDVIYDCDGYSLTGDLPSGTIGVFVNRTVNVTVRNCGISDYSYGAVSYGGSDTTFENLTVGWGQAANLTSAEGLLLVNGTGHLVSGNTINVSESAIHLTGTVSGANVSGNTVPEATYGVYLTGTLNDSDFDGNIITNVEDGFRVPGGSWIGEEVDVTGNRFRGNTVINSSHAFIIVNSTGNVFEYNRIENAFGEGFYLLQSRDNLSDSVFRFNNLTNVDDAFYMYYSGNNVFEGNIVNGTFSYVFWFLGSGNSTMADNIIPSARYMAYFAESPDLTLTGNLANGTGEQYAAQVVSSPDFMAFNNSIAGFSKGPWHWDAFSGLENANVSYINNTFADMNAGESLYCVFCPNSTFSGNLFTNISSGMLIGDASNVVISDNTILDKSSGFGFFLTDLVDLNMSGNSVQGLYVPNATFDGACLQTSGVVNGRFVDNELSRCYNLASLNYMNASLVDNLTLADGNTAISLLSSFGNIVLNVTASNITDSFSAGRGAQLSDSSGNQLRNFSLSGSSAFGAYLSNTSSNVFEDFDISGAGTGLFVGEGPGEDQLYGFHFHNNSRDISLNVTSVFNTIHLFNAIFDNPAGDYVNFTNLTIHDTVNAGDSFSISWSANSTSPPWPILLGKHINITNSTYIALDLATWHWTDTEASGHDESRFKLWKDNGTWSDTGAYLDTGANTLTLEEYDSFSGFAILIDGNCPVINESGTFIQPLDYTGAPNAIEHGPTNACVVINADDVVYDCAGRSITNDASFAAAFYVNASDNVTIRNCTTSGYYDDIYAQQSGMSEVSDNRFNASYSILEMNASASPGMMFVRNNASSSSAYALINARNYYDGANIFTTDISGSLVENNTVDGVTYTEIVSEAANLSGITVRNNDFNAPGLYAMIYADDHFGTVHTGTDLSDALIEDNSADVSYAAIVSDAANVRNIIIRNNTLGVPGGMSYLIACQVYYDGLNAYVTDLSNATIESNIVNLGSSAIGASSGADVSGLTMRDNSFNGGGIFSLASVRRSDFGTVVTIAEFEDSLIENNTINNLGFAGLELYGASASGLVFRNNTANGSGIYAMIDAGTVQSGNAVYPTDMTGSLIEGNHFERISYTGINARGSDLSGMVFRNNSLLNNESSGSAYAAFNIQSIDNGTDLLARGNISGADIEDNAFSGFSIILSLTGADASGMTLARSSVTTLAQMNSFVYAYPQASDPVLFSHVDLSGANISDNNATYYAYGINAQGTDMTDALISGNRLSAGASLGTYGIGLQSYTPGSLVYESDISGTAILGNEFDEYSTGIYLLNARAGNLTVKDNEFIDALSRGSYGIFTFRTFNPDGFMTDSEISDNAFENIDYGISLLNGSNISISDNSFIETGYPVYLIGNSLDQVRDNDMADIANAGIYLSDSRQNSISGNDIAGSGNFGIQVLSSYGNTFQGDTISSVINFGLYLLSSSNNTFEDTAITGIINAAGPAYGLYMGGSNNNSFDNISTTTVTSEGSEAAGVYLGGSNDNSFTGSLVSDVSNPSGPAYGVYLGGSNNNSFTNVTSGNVSSATGDASGFYLGGSSNNTLLGSTASGNLDYGFYLTGAGGNLMSGSEAYGNGQAGLYLSGSSGNLFDANLFHDNPIGYRLSGSGSNMFLDNVAANNTETGALVHFGSSSNNFTDDILYGNPEGIETGDGASSNIWTSPHLYMNTLDFLYNGSGSSYGLSGAIFDSASGAFQNFTNLSVNDSVGAPETYHITWDSEPAAPPSPSFAGKFIEIINYTPVSIDSAVWHWTDAEAAGYDEALFELWKSNGTWSLQNGTPDTAANELSLSGLAEFSVFGILQAEAPSAEDDDDGGDRPLRVSLESACEGNLISVRSGSSPVSGVQVRIDGQSIGTTDSSGTIAFSGCGKSVDVRASKSGYVTEEESFSLVSCEVCEVPQNETVPTAPEPEYECLSDDDCADTDFCSIPAGAQGGECLPVQSGACGEVKTHRFVPFGYQCGTEPGCPSCPAGEQCVDHACIAYGLSGPVSVLVNATAIIRAFNSTGSCVLCDLVIIDPAGNELTGKTDENGSFILPASLKGIYNVTLLVDGRPFRSILVNALPVSLPAEPGKPTEASPEEQFPWWIVILLILLLALIAYWRRRKKK